MTSLDSLNRYPLSSSQREIWFDQILHPDVPLYNVGGYLRIDGPIDPAIFEKALNQVIEENDALRIMLIKAKTLPTQLFAENVHIKLDFHDFSNQKNSKKQALEWMQREFVKPFQLYEGLLFQFALCKVSENCYYWLKKYHHLIGDGWAISLIVQRVAVAYNTLTGKQHDVEHTYNSYRDFIQNDQSYFLSENFAKAQRYWREKYREVPEPLIQCRYTSQFQEHTIPSRRAVLHLERTFYNQFVAFAKEHKKSTFHIILGVLYCYFIRTTGQTDFVVGLPTLNRSTATFKKTVGLFTSVIPAKFCFDTHLSFIELLQAIGTELRKDYRHQRFPVSEINKQVDLYKEGRRQLFDITLSYLNNNYDTHFGGSAVEMRLLTHGVEQNALVIFVNDFHKQREVKIDFDYNLGAFKEGEIEGIKVRFEFLLNEVLLHPKVPIRELQIMPEAELNTILFDFNNTATNYPSDQCVHQLFEAQVKTTPEAVAVVFENQQLSYRDLNQRANQLAHYLQTLGVKPEILVGICLERSVEMVIGLLSILKAGGAYVPLDPAYPVARLAFMLEDAQVSVLLTQSSLTEELPETKAQVVCLDIEAETLSQFAEENVVSGVGPENLAYVIYTSGSTGKPKGAMNTHQGICNRLLWMQDAYQLTCSDSVLQKTPFSFDVSVWEFFWPLLVGTRLVMAKPDGHKEPNYLVEIIIEQKITTLHFVPSMLHVFVQAQGLENCTSLKRVICSGEALPFELQERFFARSQAQLHNLYGPTEAAVDVTYWQCQRESHLNHVPIGRPIANTQIYLIDHLFQIVPIGVPGELYIGGVGLARGYLNRQELTAEKFIKNPFSDASNSRLYKTGDLARYLPDGNIEYLGRIDNQVKIRGFRIELPEIETVLAQHSAVQENTVVVHKVSETDKRLVAYVVPQKEQIIENKALRDFLIEQLPDYMIPSAFVTLESLPLTPNGKIDRRILEQKSLGDYQFSEETFVAPRTPEEELLAGIWSAVLGVEQVGIHDNFFELGGHSLLATQVISRIRDTFAVELSLRELFESPTIAGLNDKRQAVHQQTPLPKIIPVNRSKPLRLSFAQQRLWFLNQLEGPSATYNIPITLRLEGSLHQKALAQSLHDLVQRHESLRMAFPSINGAPRVQISNQPFQLEILDLRALSPAEAEPEVQRLLMETANCPFDLATGPLFRATLLQFGATSHILQINMHHIISDGWSIGIFMREWCALYDAFSQEQPSPLSPLPIQYVDFANWQRQLLTGEVLNKQLNYWKQQLVDIPTLLELPTDYSRPPVQRYQGARLSFSLSDELTAQLKHLSQQMGTTLFMTLWSAFATLLSRYSGQSDIVIGSPIANRTQSQTESIFGFFLNTLVLRLDLTNNLPFEDILLKARPVALEAYSHQDLPFEQLVEELQPVRSLSHSQLFQVMFVLQNAPLLPDLELAGLNLTQLELKSVIAKFDLALEFTETVSGLTGRLEYNTDLFERATIERLSGHLQTLLTGIVANPKTPIHELPLLTKAEQQQLLAWNNTAVDYPQDKCVHQLFEAQVETTPEAVAVVFENQQLSYRELNQRANQLAHYLQTLGVKPEVLVGICLERSVEMVIGLLSILKAGGAYVPLDPAYPVARLAFMLEDAQVSVLLTQESLKERLPETQTQVVCLDIEAEALSRFAEENVVSGVGPENLAYVIYTSGSTGKPKGVAIEHHSAVVLLKWAKEVFTSEEIAGVLASTSICFDLSVFELFVPISWGRKIILVENVLQLPTLAADLGVTLVNTVPSAMGELVRTKNIPASVRVVNLAGEALQSKLVQQIYQQETIEKVFNLYGPSEDTTYSTWAFLQKESKEPPSIGCPITNTQVYVLDTHFQPVPIGVCGELYIGGDGLARGYLNQPELTAEKFISNPFQEGTRLYKTGDLVRYRADGSLEFLGRIDNQVKIRGFRIELGEIETRLNQYSTVQEAAVIAREDKPGDKRLVAYIVSKLIPDRLPLNTVCQVKVDNETPITLNTEDISCEGIGLVGPPQTWKTGQQVRIQMQLPDIPDELCLEGYIAWCNGQRAGIAFTNPSVKAQFCQTVENIFESQCIMKVIQRTSSTHLREVLRQKLPDYMIPASFVFLKRLPLTPNGKVDRKALPQPSGQRLDSGTSYIAPQTKIEQKIASCWQTVLGIDKIGVHDNFFDSGGNSLLLVQVQEKLIEMLNQEVPIFTLFQYPTISALVHHLEHSFTEQREQTGVQEDYDQASKKKEARNQYQERRRKSLRG